jgi:hypothetical protein
LIIAILLCFNGHRAYASVSSSFPLFNYVFSLQDDELEKMKAQLADMEKEAAKLQEVQVRLP